MMKHIFVLVAALVGGCATFPEHYNQLGLPEDELALVTGSYKPGFFYTDYAVYFVRVYDENGSQVIGNPNPKSWNYARLEQVRLQPGKYLFHTVCDIGNAYAFPSIALAVESRKTYLLTCEKIYKKDFLGINVVDKIGLSVEEVGASHKSENAGAKDADS